MEKLRVIFNKLFLTYIAIMALIAAFSALIWLPISFYNSLTLDGARKCIKLEAPSGHHLKAPTTVSSDFDPEAYLAQKRSGPELTEDQVSQIQMEWMNEKFKDESYQNVINKCDLIGFEWQNNEVNFLKSKKTIFVSSLGFYYEKPLFLILYISIIVGISLAIRKWLQWLLK